MLTIGLDVGGANTKIVALRCSGEDNSSRTRQSISVERAQATYFPFWERRDEFPDFLQGLCPEILGEPHKLGVTMTAELTDCFRTKKEGVAEILSSVAQLDPKAQVLTSRGSFLPLRKAIRAFREVAAANWAGPGIMVGKLHEQAILIDIGSTTTDITPILKGTHPLSDTSDLSRLRDGNLVYTGSLRTNVAAIVDHVMLGGRAVEIASEQFATTADVNMLLGLIDSSEYTVPTSDGGAPDQDGARIRLSRVLCADPSETKLEDAISVASYIHRMQVGKVTRALMSVIARHQLGRDVPCYLAGVGGELLGRPASQTAGLTNVHAFHECIEKLLGRTIAQRERLTAHAPASSIACLLLLGICECGY